MEQIISKDPRRDLRHISIPNMDSFCKKYDLSNKEDEYETLQIEHVLDQLILKNEFKRYTDDTLYIRMRIYNRSTLKKILTGYFTTEQVVDIANIFKDYIEIK